MTRLTPLADRITVELVDPYGNQTATGFLVPKIVAANRPYEFGKVLEVGTGRVNIEGLVIPLMLKPGDMIAFPKKAGVMFPLPDANGVEHEVILMREADVLGIVHELPQVSLLSGLDGALLRLTPSSRAIPDQAYENEDSLARAEHLGIIDKSEHPPDRFQPGDGPDNVTVRDDQGKEQLS